jgi:hypothetical protein
MNTFRWAFVSIVVGLLFIAAAVLWPAVPNPRARWTGEKAAQYQATSSELQSLSHDLAGQLSHAAGAPSHVHSPTETIADPRLTALELERVAEHSAALQAELEAARQIPPGWHLLAGLVGAVLAVVGIIVAVTAFFRHDRAPQ